MIKTIGIAKKKWYSVRDYIMLRKKKEFLIV